MIIFLYIYFYLWQKCFEQFCSNEYNLDVKSKCQNSSRDPGEGMLLQSTLLQACCVILIFLIISVVSMVSLIIYLSQCTHAMTSGMT